MSFLHRDTGVTLRSKVVALAAMTASAVLLLSGCANLSSEPESQSEWQQRQFEAVYEQEVDWQECGESYGFRDGMEEYLIGFGAHVEGLRCAWITAPLDWNDPENKETIRLSTLFIPATGDKPLGTLLSNPGGPGASGTEFALGLTTDESFAAVHEQYNLLGFDPRGISRSTPVHCDSETDITELALALCAREYPLALSMGTAQVARDMELMRSLVEDDQLNYAGFSYGTTIGASYATLFPENVGRVMLDSAWPSDWSSPLGGYLQAEAIASATNTLLQGCAEEYGVQICPIGDEAALKTLMDQLDSQPLVATDGTEIGGRMLDGYLTTSLYLLGQGRHDVLDVTGRALSGDQEAIDQIATAMADGGASVGRSGQVVRCLSTPADPNLVALDDYINEHGLPVLLGGPEINDDTIRDFFDLSCDGLPDRGKDHLDFANTGDSPILVFGITGDHATPYQGAADLVNELGNATLVTLEGTGHIASFQKRSSCADKIAVAYFLKGEMPAEGTVCTDD